MSKTNNNHVRIRDIADALGLSTATVSNVIHDKTAKISEATVARVRQALDEFGYTPNMAAISLAQSYSPIVGVLVGATQRYMKDMLTDPFISRTLDSIASELESRGYFLMLRREHDILSVPKYAAMWNWAGAIFMGFSQQAYETLEGKMPVPYAIVDGGYAGSEHYSSVRLDNYSAGRKAAEYLLEKHHTKLGFVFDSERILPKESAGTTSLRFHGLNDAVRELCPSAPEIQQFPLPGTLEERCTVYESIRQQVLKGELTAVFSIADLFAVELTNFLNDAGIQVPEQLSVIGFDDIDSASSVRPRLTTFRQDLANRGAVVTDLLLQMVEQHQPPQHLTAQVEMIERESVCENLSAQ